MGNAHYEAIKAMFALVPPANGWRRPEWVKFGQRRYRGKRQFVAGYSHSRIGAHHFSGRSYDRILGWGETQEAAINMMRRKLEIKARGAKP